MHISYKSSKPSFQLWRPGAVPGMCTISIIINIKIYASPTEPRGAVEVVGVIVINVTTNDKKIFNKIIQLATEFKMALKPANPKNK